MASKARFGIALAFLAYASWGLLSPVGKHFLATGAYLPFGLNAVRFALAAVLFIACLKPSVQRESMRLLLRRDVLWVNVLANASLTLFLYSLAALPHATYATLGFYTAPLWTAALAHVTLGERVGPWFAPAAAGLLLGGYVALFGLQAPQAVGAWGMALAVSSGLVWAFYSVALRRFADQVPLAPLMGASFIFGAAWYGVPALVLEGPPALLHQTAASWGWMAVYVAVPTLASFILFNAALQRAPASLVNLLVGAELGFTALFAALLFAEPFTAAQVGGLGLVLVSVTAYLWVQSRTPSPK
ncbi:MAG: DMT family transporter [bacterium]